MRKQKILLVIATLCLLVLAFSFNVSAQVNDGWVSHPDGTWSYYENGEIVRDQWRLDSKGWVYLDWDGIMVTNDFVYDSQGECYVDANGYCVTSNWVYTSRYESWEPAWYYCDSNGHVVSEEVVLIGGKYYAFDYNGEMYEDTEFLIDEYDSNGSYMGYSYYRAKANGELYVKTWFEDEWDNWYYYGEGGKAANGLTTIGGATYYFYSDGYMVHDQAFENNGSFYYADEDGKLHNLPNNTWTKYNDEWFYVQNGQLCSDDFYTIGGVTYYFGWNGRMYSDTTFGVNEYDEELDYYVHSNYYAKENGAIAENEWINRYNTWYYYGEGGKAPNGIATVGGVTYYFIYDGQMATDQAFQSGDICYYADENGILFELPNNTWTECGDNWFYVQDGNLCSSGFYTIGGELYYFSYNGYMYSDEVFAVGHYDETLDQYVHNYYYAKENGIIAVNGWIQIHNNWYYANIDGSLLCDGVYEINGALYAFDSNGCMRYDTIYDNYLVSEDGYIITTNGWHAYSSSWIYIKDGRVYEGWLQLDNTWYYFDPYMSYCDIISDGNLLYATAVNGTYTPITADGFYTHSNGYTVYVTNGTIVRDNWASIDGYWYYFNDYGAMITNSTYEIDGVRYYFDLNGKMASGGWISPRPDTWMWAYANGALFTGLDNSGYVFSEYGYLLDEGVYEVNDRIFVVDANGKKVAELYNIGWNQVGVDWYYVGENYEGGYYAFTDRSFEDADGRYYYFGYDGKMLRNERRNERYYGADGAAVKGWSLDDGEWYYADGDYCYFVSGLHTINNIEYYFRNCVLQTNVTTIYENQIISTNGDGVVVSKTDANGWIYDNREGYGYVYYYENGEAFDGWKGDYFIENGEMRRDSVVYSNDKNYYVGKNGLCVYNQWIERKEYYGYGGYASTYDYAVDTMSSWMLARADGSLVCDDWYSNGINWYYFDYVYMASDCIIEIDGEYHEFDKNGIWLGQVSDSLSSNVGDGWYCEDGEWYFYMAGERVEYGKEIYFNGNWYRLNYDGEMVTDRFYYSNYVDGYYYYDANGIRLEATGWQKINGRWTYFTKEHLALDGWINDGGVKYYQAWDYSEEDEKSYISICTGVNSIDGKLRYFDNGGVYQYDITGHGWYQADGEWYYLDEGELVYGEYEYYINGAYYAFSYDGTMYTDTIIDGRYYSESGQMVTTSGWYIVNNKYIYIDSEGYVCRGVHVIDGKEYYFDGYYI